MRYRYGMRTAYEAGETEHPQVVIRKTFPDATDWEPAPIGDCWFFTAEERVDLPMYILPFGSDGGPIWDYHKEPR